QRPVPALPIEIQLDGGRGGGITPGLQIIHRPGFVALEKSGANGPDHGALARLVGADEQIDARLQIRDFQRLAKLAQLFDPYAAQPHGRASAGDRSRSNPARMTSASRAVSASSPCWRCCSSAITS